MQVVSLIVLLSTVVQPELLHQPTVNVFTVAKILGLGCQNSLNSLTCPPAITFIFPEPASTSSSMPLPLEAMIHPPLQSEYAYPAIKNPFYSKNLPHSPETFLIVLIVRQPPLTFNNSLLFHKFSFLLQLFII